MPLEGHFGKDTFGSWGGTCTCPDGQTYQVGDLGDQCSTLACYGGTPGKCNTQDGPWSNKGVVCAVSPRPIPTTAPD